MQGRESYSEEMGFWYAVTFKDFHCQNIASYNIYLFYLRQNSIYLLKIVLDQAWVMGI